MATLAIIILALLAHKGFKHAKASPIPDESSDRPCTSFTEPVPITAHQHIYDIAQVNNNIDAVHYAQDLDTWDNPPFAERIIQNITISKTYDIHAQLCVPPNGSKKSYLQLATHGAAFDGRYWDSEIESKNYSYVDAALGAGYSILTYDRLGCGQSSKPDAYTEVQAPAELEILRVISEMARSGKISSYASNSSSYHNTSVAFDKIIHVGHSYGSVMTYALIAIYPNVSDAAVLTGFINSKEFSQQRKTTFALEYAPQNDLELFADTSSGYVVPGTQGAIQTGFFSSRVNTTTGIGGFDPKILEYAFSLRQPYTGPQLGSADVLMLEAPSAPQYLGPVQMMVGEFDWLICLGDCRNTYNTTQVHEMFPKAKDVDIYVQPGASHGLSFHYDAPLGFQATFDWLNRNGF